MLATTNVYSGYLQKLRRFIRRHEMLLGGEPVLVAVSGGVDSMVLLDMLLRLAPTMNLKLGVAHYEHGLRGEASKQDAQFVVEAARRHGLKVYVGHGDVKQIAEDHKLSLEEAARRARYTFLRKVARKHRFPVVVTAHSANDNAETVLLNLIRGSGVRGLAAIPPMRQMGEGVILGRPFLDFERSEIERYARELEIEWREDESNESTRFMRNRLRSELLPMLQQYNPSIIGTLNTTAEIMRNLEQYLSQSVQTAIERVIVEKSKERLALNLHQIKHYLPAMQTEIVQRGVSQAFDIPPISFNATERALALLYRETGQKTDLGAGLTALRDRDSLVVLRELPLPPELEHPFERGEDLEVGRVRLRSADVPRDRVQFSKNGRVEFFDADKLPAELVVRSWREGDRFRPLGMEGEKKVSDFLVDAKTPRDRKRHVLVLASDDAIVWVCGMRIDERFKVTDETTNVLRIEMQVLPPNQPSQRAEGERSGRGGRGRGGEGGRGEGGRGDAGRGEGGRSEGGRGGRGGRGEKEAEQRQPREGARADDRHSDRRGEAHRGDERPREERFGVDAGRDDKPRDDRGGERRNDRPRDDRGGERRNEKPRDERGERGRDEKPRQDRPRDERPRDERPGGETPRDERPRDERGGRQERGRDDRRRDGRRDEPRRRPEPGEGAERTVDEATPSAEGSRETRTPEARGGGRGDDRRGGRREGDRREGDRREGDRREGDRREGDKSAGDRRGADRREGDRGEGARAEGDRREANPREGDRRESDRPEGDRREGDRPEGNRREGDRREGDRREGDRRGGRREGERRTGEARPEPGERARGAESSEDVGRASAAPSSEPTGVRPTAEPIAPPMGEPSSEAPAKARRAPAKPRKTAAEKRADAAAEVERTAGEGERPAANVPAAAPVASKRGAAAKPTAEKKPRPDTVARPDTEARPDTVARPGAGARPGAEAAPGSEPGADAPAPTAGRVRSPRAPRRTPTVRKKRGSDGGDAGEQAQPEE